MTVPSDEQELYREQEIYESQEEETSSEEEDSEGEYTLSEAYRSQSPDPGIASQMATVALTPLLAHTLDPSTANLQFGSPLFSTIPPEIRNEIFRYALSASEKADERYPEGSFYYRPGHKSALVVSAALLLTCRRIYLESTLLLCQENELLYWWGRPPPLREEKRNPATDLDKLSPEQRAHTTIHVFVQQGNLEDGFRKKVLLHPQFRPAQLTLTLRHTDWWWWENRAPLALDAKSPGQPLAGNESSQEDAFHKSSWGHALSQVVGLQRFVLELETEQTKQAELEEIVQRAQKWTFTQPDGATLVCDAEAKTTSTWEGINRYYEIEDQERVGSFGTIQPSMTSGLKLQYYVVKLTWKRRPPAKNTLALASPQRTLSGAILGEAFQAPPVNIPT